MKKLIKQFNKPNTYLIISDYPEKTKYGENNYGIAWHTKQIIEPMAKQYGVNFVVLAEKGMNNRPKLYVNGKILVLRIFEKKHHSLFPSIIKWLIAFHNIKQVHVHSEFCANGGIINQVMIVPFLLLIKLARKNITYFAHNVVLNLYDIAPHLNLKQKSLAFWILNTGIKYYYRVLDKIVDKFVVMDGVIKTRLSYFVSPNKIFLSNFWVEKIKSAPSLSKAKKLLGFSKNEFVLLCFGFITYYKGADWIVETVKKLRKQQPFKKIHLVLAGGNAHSLKHKPYYRQFYKKVLQSVQNQKSITITGFVPEHKIPLYFAATDLVVLPYRGFIGASASMTHAIKYKKPFIFSNKMSELFANEDIHRIYSKNGLSKKDVTFAHSSQSFSTILKKAFAPQYRTLLTHVSKDLAKEKNAESLIEKCYNELYNSHEQSQPSFSRSYFGHKLNTLASK